VSQSLEVLTQLNMELIEALELCLYCAEDFCEKNNIPFQNPKLARLLDKVTRLMDEIDSPPFCKPSTLSRRNFTEKKDRRGLDRTKISALNKGREVTAEQTNLSHIKPLCR
jgi:hypothetical protein